MSILTHGDAFPLLGPRPRRVRCATGCSATASTASVPEAEVGEATGFPSLFGLVAARALALRPPSLARSTPPGHPWPVHGNLPWACMLESGRALAGSERSGHNGLGSRAAAPGVAGGIGDTDTPLPRPVRGQLSGTPADLPQPARVPLLFPLCAAERPGALVVGRRSGPAPSNPARRGRCPARGSSQSASASAPELRAAGKPSSAGWVSAPVGR